MPSLKQIIQPALRSRLTQDLPDFLPRQFDANTSHQAGVWNAKTYRVDPRTHVFTTIQEHFGNRLIKSITLPKGAVVVDIGCFIGEKLWQLNHSHPYLGIGADIAVSSLRAAQKIDIHNHKFIAADIENLPFKNNSVDLVMVFDVIEHLTHADQGFAEVARVLKPGGRFLLHIPLKDNAWSMFWFKQKLFPKAADKDYADVGHSPERMLTRAQINNYLTNHHLIAEKTIPYNAFFVHFWDREFARITAWALARLFRHGLTQTAATRTVHTGNLGSIRAIYGRLVVPILELLSWPDWILTRFGVANTYFVLAKKVC